MTPKEKAHHQTVLTTAHHDYQKGLNSRAFFNIHDRAIGEDMVQETFIKTWNYLVKGGKIQTMKAFLYHILNNLIIDEYRKQKHRSTSLDVLLEKGFEPSENDSDRLIDFLDGKGALALIGRLPVAYQKIMHMRYVQDFSVGEMSLLTGQSKNNISVQLHRGLQKLKILYKTAEQL